MRPIAVAAGGLALAAATLMVGMSSSTGSMCDGGVPEWMVPDDYAGGGCVDMLPAWQALLPGNWAEWRIVCLGMCGSIEDVYRRD